MFSYETGGRQGSIRPNLEVGKLPRLKVIPIGSLLLHEEPDEERWRRLRSRIEADGLLKHPPIAARDHGSAKHILLDGVNRVKALGDLGASWLLIQEVDLEDDGLVLSTWHHVVEGVEVDAALEETDAGPAVSRTEGRFTPGGDFEPVFDQATECLIVKGDRSTYAVETAPSPEGRLQVVGKVAELVHSAPNRDRVSYTNVSDLVRHYSDFSALVCYRAFTKREVLNLSLKGLKFPSGVTRFSVPKRTLYFDLPFAFLQGGGSAEAKQVELDEMIKMRIRKKSIRFYVEPTFIFDD